MSISIDYKSELELSNLRDIALENDINGEDEYYIINDLFKTLVEIYELWKTEQSCLIKYKMIELYNIIDGRNLPFSESIIQSGILDFCLDRYSRFTQDADCGKYGLKIINCFAHFDSQYCEYIISQNSIGNFLEISKNSIKKAFSEYFPLEIDTINCIISNKATCHHLDNYCIDDIIKGIRKIGDYRTQNVVYDFMASFLQQKIISEVTVLNIFQLFKIIKEKNDYNSDYTGIYTLRWSQILLCLITTDYFDIELFLEGALFDFYEQNYANPDHIPSLCAFYTNFIYKFPDQRLLLRFDFYRYFYQIQISESHKLKEVLYSTLADYIYIFSELQKKDIEEGKSCEFDFNLFIQEIPNNFIQNDFLCQISTDINNGGWNTKLCALCLLAYFSCVRSDIILNYINPVEFIDLFKDFTESPILNIILRTIESLYNTISPYQNSPEILHAITETETYQNLCQLVEKQEIDKDLILEIQNVIKYFSVY